MSKWIFTLLVVVGCAGDELDTPACDFPMTNRYAIVAAVVPHQAAKVLPHNELGRAAAILHGIDEAYVPGGQLATHLLREPWTLELTSCPEAAHAELLTHHGSPSLSGVGLDSERLTLVRVGAALRSQDSALAVPLGWLMDGWGEPLAPGWVTASYAAVTVQPVNIVRDSDDMRCEPAAPNAHDALRIRVQVRLPARAARQAMAESLAVSANQYKKIRTLFATQNAALMSGEQMLSSSYFNNITRETETGDLGFEFELIAMRL